MNVAGRVRNGKKRGGKVQLDRNHPETGGGSTIVCWTRCGLKGQKKQKLGLKGLGEGKRN